MLKNFATNFFGAMCLSRAILPHFREKKRGTLLYLSSILAHSAIPTSGTYAATKGAIESECCDVRCESCVLLLIIDVLPRRRALSQRRSGSLWCEMLHRGSRPFPYTHPVTREDRIQCQRHSRLRSSQQDVRGCGCGLGPESAR